jgi:hypothetical protein
MDDSDIQILNNDPLSVEAVETLQYFGDDLLQNGDDGECQDFVGIIAPLLQQKGVQIERVNPDVYKLYEKYLLLASFKGFLSINDSIQESLIQKKVLAAVQLGFEPDDLITAYQNSFSTPEFIKQEFDRLAKNLEKNTEQFGSTPIELGGSRVLPLIKNWLADYNHLPKQNSSRGSVERLNYINQSQNTRQLTQTQRSLLLKILEFYDDLLNPQVPETKTSSNSEIPNEAPPVVSSIDQKLEALKNRT